MIIVAASFGSALLGALVGFAGAFILEGRRDARHGNTVVSSVSLELALLSASLKDLAINRVRIRNSLQNAFWDRYGPELVNYLLQHLLKAIYLLYLDEFDQVQKCHDLVCAGKVTEDLWPETGAMLLSWASRAERLLQLIGEERGKTRRLNPKSAKHPDAKWQEIVHDLDSYAAQRAGEQGFPTDSHLKVRLGDDGTLVAERVNIKTQEDGKIETTPA